MALKDDKIQELTKRYGYQRYMIERYFALFGIERLIKFLEGNERKIQPAIRINTLRISKEALQNRLEEKGFLLKSVPWVNEAFVVQNAPFSIGASIEYLLGYYYIQSISSMIPGDVLRPSPHELVVDMCAAPGGKTTHLAQIMENKGAIIALDLNRARMKSLRSNLSRCGVENVIAIRMDAANLDDLKLSNISKILLDAPCTGSGLIPIDPTRKRSRELKDITFCSSIQMKLLKAAVENLESGGEIVYSTCSIEPEENEFVIDAILSEMPVEIVETNLNFGEPGFTNVFGRELSSELNKAKRFYPFLHNIEGFFICKLRKV